jgi:antitoxin component YwqK of YwqJK toxin-antitoxin module
VHGIRATYYGDGKTLYSKQTFNRGRKQGPATWYYKSGQIFKQTNFEEGKRQGLTRVYYKSGKLSAEFKSEHGVVLPGLKEYKKDGTLITSYPDVQFRELDFLASKNRVDLEIYCTKKRSGVKFYILNANNGATDRVYLITKNDSAHMQFYVKSGEVLHREVNILAEIPTELGNVLAKKYSYQLSVSN